MEVSIEGKENGGQEQDWVRGHKVARGGECCFESVLSCCCVWVCKYVGKAALLRLVMLFPHRH